MRLGSRWVRFVVGGLAISVLLLGRTGDRLAGEARADGDWTLLPEAQWSDQFSPLYTDGYGNYCEGDPTYEPGDDMDVFEYQWLNPVTEENETVQAIQNTVLVNFHATVSVEDIEDILGDHDLSIVTAWFEPDLVDPGTSMSWFQCEILPASAYYDDVPGMVAALEALASVEFAEANDFIPMCQEFPEIDPDDPEFGNQPEFERLSAPEAWQEHGYGQANTIGVAILDSGVDVDHEDLADKIFRHPTGNYRMGVLATRKKFKMGNLDTTHEDTKAKLRTIFLFTDSTSGQPVTGPDAHGTAVAGIVGAKTNNDTGVASCGPGIRVLPIAIENKVDNNAHSNFHITAAVVNACKALRKNFVQSKGIANLRVANYSAGGTKQEKSVLKAMKKDRKKGHRIYVAAASNGTIEQLNWPAADPLILGVTGADFETLGYDSKHLGSNYWCGSGEEDPDLDVYGISAYYDWSKTTDITGSDGFAAGNYTAFSGTSAATPQISALAALMISENPNLSVAAVDAKIKVSTKGDPEDAILHFTVGEETKGIPAVVSFLKAMDPD